MVTIDHHGDVDGSGKVGAPFDAKQGSNDYDHHQAAEMLAVKPMSIVFKGVNSFVPNPALLAGGGGHHKGGEDVPKKKQVLFEISGGVQPGEVLALMGPSGSGKTSLLSILGGRFAKEIDVEGEVLYNGSKSDKNLKRKMGFVSQDDLLFGALTVWETLWYTAKLRLPGEMPRSEREWRVKSVLSTLGLEGCRDTIIGGMAAGAFIRGVSGGERKRVSVGNEMLINPALLFLDEPTSGLDSTTALSLVNTLRDLAKAGRTIVSTIHQPSSRMFQRLDKLLLLSQGYTMYYGGAQDAASWLDHLGVPCPFGVNLADHILDCASGNLGKSDSKNQQERVRLIESFTEFQHGNNYNIEMGYLPDAHNRTSLDGSSKVRDSSADYAHIDVDPHDDHEQADERRWATSWTNQVCVLYTRNFKVNRLESVNVQTVCQVFFVAIIVGLLMVAQLY
eukprot:scaffold260952_cov39-Prasinocladus_malaysianus.AAC.1